MKTKRKFFSILIVAILVIVELINVPMYSFAANTEESPAEVTKEVATEEKPAEGISKEAADIIRYGTYHGKNATRIPVITYHMVVTNKQKKRGYKNSSLAISKSAFDRQMRWLHKKGYRTINCDEFYLWYKGKIKLPKKTVLITFDDGHIGVANNALPVLKKYGMKGTVFIIGWKTHRNKKNTIGFNRMKQIQKEYPDMEFQSHTYGLHNHKKKNYQKVRRDAYKQRKIYGFDYLAYPYGHYTTTMIKAYSRSGIKLAFTYGKNDYATRKQPIYKIRRIKVYANGSFASFKKWFK